jgi:hypothetical protein
MVSGHCGRVHRWLQPEDFLAIRFSYSKIKYQVPEEIGFQRSAKSLAGAGSDLKATGNLGLGCWCCALCFGLVSEINSVIIEDVRKTYLPGRSVHA